MNKAIFLDRDGTLNIDHGYVHKIEDFQFIGGTIDALLELNKMGYLLVLVTNQSGIARGYFSEQQFLQLTDWMKCTLTQHGVELASIYYCPHQPQSESEAAQTCDCRKPNPGMLLQAIKALNIDIKQSFIVGDKLEDLQAGLNAGVKHKVLVKTGKPITEQGIQLADYVIESVAELPNLVRKLTP